MQSLFWLVTQPWLNWQVYLMVFVKTCYFIISSEGQAMKMQVQEVLATLPLMQSKRIKGSRMWVASRDVWAGWCSTMAPYGSNSSGFFLAMVSLCTMGFCKPFRTKGQESQMSDLFHAVSFLTALKSWLESDALNLFVVFFAHLFYGIIIKCQLILNLKSHGLIQWTVFLQLLPYLPDLQYMLSRSPM